MADASFEDGAENPIRLMANSVDDLTVLSSLLQDAVGQNAEISWLPRKQRFALLLNRFRWEDRETASTQNRPFERVQSMLVINNVLKAGGDGINPGEKESVFSMLALEFTAGEDGAGTLSVILSGDGAIRLSVEALEVTLSDVTRPYRAHFKAIPTHKITGN